jgi:hypothetical protein
VRKITHQELLRKENALVALAFLLTKLEIVTSRMRPWQKKGVHFSLGQNHEFIKRLVELEYEQRRKITESNTGTRLD